MNARFVKGELNLCRAGLASRGADHGSAIPAQPQGDGAADATRGARDQGDLPAQESHVCALVDSSATSTPAKSLIAAHWKGIRVGRASTATS